MSGFREDVISDLSLVQDAGICYMKKKMEKRRAEDKKLVRKNLAEMIF